LTRLAYPLQRRYGAKLEAHWATLVQHDPASLHACICVAATNSALESGEFPLTDNKKASSPLLLDTFHHRGETIRLVNEGLSDPLKAASDELIAAVSVLLTVEVCRPFSSPSYLSLTKTDCNWRSGLSEDPSRGLEADGGNEEQLRRCR
jgi:hypothetical protein